MNKNSVLVLEYDIAFRDNLQQFLSGQGFDVESVSSIATFEQTFNKYPFSAVILDLELPDGSGIEILQFLSHHEDIIKLMVSGKAELEAKLNGYRYGADIVFQKPLALPELGAALTNLIKKQRTRGKVDNLFSLHSNYWTFQANNWSLNSPENLSVPLTNKEKSFLSELLQAEDFIVSKDRLLKVLGYEAKGLHGRKALDVMVARLRKKIKDITEMEAPIKTIYQEGFQFTGFFQRRATQMELNKRINVA